MEKTYAPHDIERRTYARWESNGWFAPGGHGAPFSIVIPPPNVTGTLHMGHAFQHTLMDALTRRPDDTRETHDDRDRHNGHAPPPGAAAE